MGIAQHDGKKDECRRMLRQGRRTHIAARTMTAHAQQLIAKGCQAQAAAARTAAQVQADRFNIQWARLKDPQSRGAAAWCPS